MPVQDQQQSHHVDRRQRKRGVVFGGLSSGRTAELLVPAFLALATILAVVMYWRFVEYNLPASSHVDERRGLGMLLRFHEGSLDPGFFYYPTLLYYVVYAVGELFGGPQVFLAVGRAVTLLAGAALGIAAFWMVRILTRSRWAALITASLLLWNPVLAGSASYMSTDLLTALLVTIALGCYLTAIRDASGIAWVLAFVLAGLATSAKYNAAILVVALMLSDVLRAAPALATRSRAATLLNGSLPPAPLRAALLLIGTAVVLAATLTPMDVFVGMVRSGAELNSVVDSADIAFIRAKLSLFTFTGALLIGYAALTAVRPSLLEPLRPVRVYIGPAIALLMFALTTPFAVLSFTKFVYDFGSQLKALDMEGDNSQWLAYPRFYLESFGSAVSILTIVGLIALRSIAARRMLVPLLLFAGLYLVIISRSTLAFPRYLLAILPILLGCAAWGLVVVLRRVARTHIVLAAALLVVISAVSFHAMGSGVRNVLARADHVDEWHTALRRVNQIHPRIVYVAGFVPDVELRMAGYDVRPVPEAELRTVGPPSAEGSAVLLIDAEIRQTANLRGAVLVWSDTRRFGQYLFAPR